MTLDDLKYAQRKRILHLDRCLTWRGRANRRDLTDRFGISGAQAALDFRVYLDLVSGVAPPVYDAARKTYLAAPGHIPLVAWEQMDAFPVLSDASPDGLPGSLPPLRKATDARIVARLHDAMQAQEAIHVRYTSMATGKDEGQWIAPVRFTSDGESVHVRAFSFKHEGYRTYLPVRIDPCSRFDRKTRVEPLPHDTDWHTQALIHLRPKNGLSPEQADVIRREYGFEGEHLVIRTRKALEFFIDSRWGLDREEARLEIARIDYRPVDDIDVSAGSSTGSLSNSRSR